jgi:hypothetical protein
LIPTYESYVGVISASGNVNMRKEASTSAEIIGSVSPGTIVTIIGESDDGAWLQIDIRDEIQAWVASSLIVEGTIPLVTAAGSSSNGSPLDSNTGNNQANNSNQGNDGSNKFGCDGRGNSCNAPGQNKDKKSGK